MAENPQRPIPYKSPLTYSRSPQVRGDRDHDHRTSRPINEIQGDNDSDDNSRLPEDFQSKATDQNCSGKTYLSEALEKEWLLMEQLLQHGHPPLTASQANGSTHRNRERTVQMVEPESPPPIPKGTSSKDGGRLNLSKLHPNPNPNPASKARARAKRPPYPTIKPNQEGGAMQLAMLVEAAQSLELLGRRQAAQASAMKEEAESLLEQAAKVRNTIRQAIAALNRLTQEPKQGPGK